MAYTWAKVYIEIVDDHKMGNLPDCLWRRVIELILLAKKNDKDGFLPGMIEMSWALRMSSEQLEADLEKLSHIGIVEIKDGGWYLTNFVKRQAAEPVVERVRNFRKRNEKPICNDDVTQSYQTKTRLDIDSDQNENTGAQKAPETKPRKLSERQQALTTLESEFCSITAIPSPRRQTDKEKQSASVGWWQPLAQIWELEGKDTGKAITLIRYAVKKMRGDSLTIAAPRSILKVSISLHGNGNSQHAEKPSKVYQ